MGSKKGAEGKEEKGGDDDRATSLAKNDEWKQWREKPVMQLLTAGDVEPKTRARQNLLHAISLYLAGLAVMVGYGVAVYIRADSYWEKPLGFVTAAAVVVFDVCLVVLAGPQCASKTATSILTMTVYRVVLVIGGTDYWFLGHTACFFTVAVLYAQTLVGKHLPVVDHKEKKEKKCVSMLEFVEDAFEDSVDPVTGKRISLAVTDKDIKAARGGGGGGAACGGQDGATHDAPESKDGTPGAGRSFSAVAAGGGGGAAGGEGGRVSCCGRTVPVEVRLWLVLIAITVAYMAEIAVASLSGLPGVYLTVLGQGAAADATAASGMATINGTANGTVVINGGRLLAARSLAAMNGTAGANGTNANGTNAGGSTISALVAVPQHMVGVFALFAVAILALASAARAQFRMMAVEFTRLYVEMSPAAEARRNRQAERAAETEGAFIERGGSGGEEEKTSTIEENKKDDDDEALVEEGKRFVPSLNRCRVCLGRLCGGSGGGMTTGQAFKFWLRGGWHSARLVALLTLLYLAMVGLGAYLFVFLSSPMALVITTTYPLMHLCFSVALFRWTRLKDYHFDGVTGVFVAASLVINVIMSAVRAHQAMLNMNHYGHHGSLLALFKSQSIARVFRCAYSL